MLRAMVATAASATLPVRAAEPAFPWHPVTIVQPFGAGNVLDVYARRLAEALAPLLGQPVIVETRPGASGNIAAGLVARAMPDGHTLLIHGVGIAIQPLIPDSHAPDPRVELAPISRLSDQPMVVTVNRALGVRTLGELVALARRKPGELAYGSSGIGGIQHCATLLMCQRAGIDMIHVPFANSMQTYTSLVSGDVALAFAFAGSVDAHIRAGTLVALAVTSASRFADMPDVPTVAESGYPGYAATAWTCMLATGGTPPSTIDRLYKALARVMAMPAIREMFRSNGASASAGTPAQFDAELDEANRVWAPVVRALFPNGKVG